MPKLGNANVLGVIGDRNMYVNPGIDQPSKERLFVKDAENPFLE
jgi:hypothetical protein